MKLSKQNLIKSSLFAVSVGFMASVFPSSSFAFTVTGRAVPGLIQGLSAEENFAAEGFTLIAESRIENNVGFLSVDGNDVLSYTANQALSSSGNLLVDFDFENRSIRASSTLTNLTNRNLRVWLGDLDGDPNTGQANTYDFISSTGQTLSGQRFFNGNFSAAIEVILSPREALTFVTVGSDANPRGLGDDGRSVTIATETVPEPLTILGSLTALGFGGLFKREVSKKKKLRKHNQ